MDDVVRSARFSRCGRYRYELWRSWPEAVGARGMVLVVGLNPSTADAVVDDPTIRRCMGFARDWGFAGLCVANLFAWRATRPAELKAAAEPVGPANDRTLRRLAARADLVVAAWGVHGTHRGRDVAVRRLLPDAQVLGLTRDGHPRHPLYLRRGLRPLPW